MRNLRTLLVLPALALCFSACGDDGDSESETVSPSSSSTTESEASTGGSGSDTSSDTASTTTGDTTDPSSGSETDSATAGGDACEPEDDDDECSMCLKQPTAGDGCCDQLATCRANPDCDCVVSCLDRLGMGIDGLAECQTECEVTGLPPGGVELSACQASKCGEVC